VKKFHNFISVLAGQKISQQSIFSVIISDPQAVCYYICKPSAKSEWHLTGKLYSIAL